MKTKSSYLARVALLAICALFGCSACSPDTPAITIRYADPVFQAEFEGVLERNGVAFSHVDQNGQKAVRIEALSAQELAAKTKEFDDWMRTHKPQSGNR